MFRTVKKSVQRTKQFVQEHPMISAFAAGAVVGTYYTRKVDTQTMAKMAYEWGAEAGQMETYANSLEEALQTHADFLNHTRQWIDFESFQNGTLPEGQTYKKIFAEHLRETASA